ncbi:unnamed protein product, partial [Notodromas monacha]
MDLNQLEFSNHVSYQTNGFVPAQAIPEGKNFLPGSNAVMDHGQCCTSHDVPRETYECPESFHAMNYAEHTLNHAGSLPVMPEKKNHAVPLAMSDSSTGIEQGTQELVLEPDGIQSVLPAPILPDITLPEKTTKPDLLSRDDQSSESVFESSALLDLNLEPPTLGREEVDEAAALASVFASIPDVAMTSMKSVPEQAHVEPVPEAASCGEQIELLVGLESLHLSHSEEPENVVPVLSTMDENVVDETFEEDLSTRIDLVLCSNEPPAFPVSCQEST